MLIAIAIGDRLPGQANPAIPSQARHYTELQFPPLPEVTLPPYERAQLPNGATVYLIEDRELPLVRGVALFRTGSRLEPEDKIGLANLTASVMRSGGTQQHSPEELNAILEQRAASVEASMGTTSGRVNFSSLTEDLDVVFNLFAEVIREPAFDREQFELTKNRYRGGISRRNDDPDDIAGREFSKLIYGENSPYARTAEYATLANIDRDDLTRFHQTYFRPENAIFGLVGDFDTAEMKAKVLETFGDWQVETPAPTIAPPTASQERAGGVFVAEQPQLTQSYVRIGHIGGQLDIPDYPALSVLNGVLNGFGGRLFNEVRSRLGLAYSVYGYWNPNYDYPGVFVAGGQTQSSSTVPFIRAVRREIERLQTTPISDAELAYAKESILNSFVFNFREPSQTLVRLMRYEYYGYPEDFIFQYQQGVKATTIEDVQRAAQTYLRPQELVTLVVGNTDGIQPPLSSLDRSVTAIDISIPEPKS